MAGATQKIGSFTYRRGVLIKVLDADMARLISEQRLAFIATVNADGTPNLSPKGTIRVYGPNELIFADLRSPQTISNLRERPWVEINVVDPILRKGYRWFGVARIIEQGPGLEAAIEFYSTGPEKVTDARDRIRRVVIVQVHRAAALTSPVYDTGATEAQVAHDWERHYAELSKTRRQR